MSESRRSHTLRVSAFLLALVLVPFSGVVQGVRQAGCIHHLGGSVGSHGEHTGHESGPTGHAGALSGSEAPSGHHEAPSGQHATDGADATGDSAEECRCIGPCDGLSTALASSANTTSNVAAAATTTIELPAHPAGTWPLAYLRPLANPPPAGT
ncbi:MAG TPA: hypothetical protein VK966_02170 [Longimicrobiales bacterium]|nr:hypothetical protein [Longimicrobiales bacterium]